MDHLIKPEWSTLKRLMFMKAASGGALSEYEITGNPVAFNTNLARPLSGFTIPFLPVQQGTGDPSPDNVRPIIGWQRLTAWRTGKNLFDVSASFKNPDNTETSSSSKRVFTPGTYCIGCAFSNYYNVSKVKEYSVSNGSVSIRSDGAYGISFALMLKPGKYYFTADKSKDAGVVRVAFYEKDGSYIGYDYTTTGDFTVPSNAYISNIIFYYDSDTPGDVVTYSNIQIALDSASTFSEYTGASYPVTFPATGKNLLDDVNGTIYPRTIGETAWSPSYDAKSLVFKAKPNTTYSVKKFGSDITFLRGCIIDTDPDSVTVERVPNTGYVSVSSGEFQITTGSSGGWICVQANGAVVAARTGEIIAVEGTTYPTSYEPFTNTVYGGTLDAVTGVLSVEWAEVDLGSLNYYTSAQGESTAFVNDSGVSFGGRDIICNQYKTIIATYWTDMTDNSIMAHPNGRIFRIRDDRYTDKDVFKAAMAEQGAKLVYPLETPYEIQLDPITVQTLIGDNTIWTDTNGENTVKYLKKG